MLIKYNDHLIYQLYFINKEKIIYIKDLKTVENIDKKTESQFISFNIIIIFYKNINGNILFQKDIIGKIAIFFLNL